MQRSNNITCYTHANNDGFISAIIVKQNNHRVSVKVSNYGKHPNWHELVKGQTVYVIDFNFSVYDMKRLDKEYDLVWIDHHKYRIEEFKAINFNPKGLRDSIVSAGMLVWKYFNKDLEPPLAIKLTNDYALWLFELEDSNAFNQGLRCIDARPYDRNDEMWYRLLENKNGEVQECIDRGIEYWMELMFI